MLEAFAEDTATADVVENVLGVPPTELDERFEAFLEEKLGPLADEDGLDDWREALKSSLEAFEAENFDKALEKAAEAKRIYPDYVESGNPYAVRARIFDEQGDRECAQDEQQQVAHFDEAFVALHRLAQEVHGCPLDRPVSASIQQMNERRAAGGHQRREKCRGEKVHSLPPSPPGGALPS